MTLKGVFSFFVGAGVGAAVAFNGRKVRRGLATVVVKGEEAAVSASRHIMRVSSEMAEDFQDALAEVRAEGEASQATHPDTLLSTLRNLRQDLEELQSRPKSTVQ